MNDYIISCCSTADLTDKHFTENGIFYICFHFEIDGKQYLDDLGKSYPFKQFYKRMSENAITKTSQINSAEFIDYFEPFLKSGKDIIHVSLSSGLSGVINSANIAREELEKKYPDRKIFVVDSLGASSGYGLIMDKMAKLRGAGMSIEQLYDWVNENKLKMHHWFFSTDLKFYVRGGRISKAEGWFGTALNICPLLNMDNYGRLIPRYKIRGQKKVMKTINDKMELYAQNGLDYCDKCYISHSGCYKDAKILADLIEARFKNLNGKVVINYVGTTIGSHTGPGTVALFFWGEKRTN